MINLLPKALILTDDAITLVMQALNLLLSTEASKWKHRQ